MSAQGLSSNPEISQLLSATLRRFYGEHAPAGAAERLAARHAAIWEQALAGEPVAIEYGRLSDQAASLGCAREKVGAADRDVVWMLTPEIAASLACGPGSEPICLHEVRDALSRLLRHALGVDTPPAYARAA